MPFPLSFIYAIGSFIGGWAAVTMAVFFIGALALAAVAECCSSFTRWVRSWPSSWLFP